MSVTETDLIQNLGDWSLHPNTRYVGKIDRVQVSPTEAWPTEFYIDRFLYTNGRPVTHWNRDVVAAALGKFNRQAPYELSALDSYLSEALRLA